MCGILAVIGSTDLELAKKQLQKMVHRGPDENDVIVTEYGHILGHQRLSIVDLNTGKQPIQGKDSSTYVIHNGEIYNHEELRKGLTQNHTRRTRSDSEIILHLYEERGEELLDQLDGDFAFVLVDGPKILAGRDPIGVKPLYYGKDKKGALWFASELKALVEVCPDIQEFPPGHYFTLEKGLVRYAKYAWMDNNFIPQKSYVPLREKLEQAVTKRLMSDVPIGVLLSGGLDSSLIASIAAREMNKRGEHIKSFCVGISTDAFDMVAARKVAQHIGSEHHEIIFTLEEALATLEDIIYHLESYDMSPIQCGIPMYLMMRYIQSLGIKVVLSGEGADEVFGGYMYFHDAPSHQAFQHESVKRLLLTHKHEVLRVDKTSMAASVEVRVPFLDHQFLKTAMNLYPDLKMALPGKRIGKHVLRAAFDDKNVPYLPQEVLWRTKEQFQDGVGYSWVDGLKTFAEEQITEEEFELRATLFPHNTPDNKEAFLYRKIFEGKFQHPIANKLISVWSSPWQKNSYPSGRVSSYHKQSGI
ncbi:MAG: asparagine synthase B [Candidatus Parabeggiatoa sp. nov. 2]|nr:MAG: asparagine synthase B [Gammaproteobacteria bacterium]